MGVTKVLAFTRASAFVALVLLELGCSQRPYEVLYTAKSPDGAYVVTLERLEEGTLGSTRYQMYLTKSDGSARTRVAVGTGGWVFAPVWQDASTVILPLCFGTLRSVTSVLEFRGSKEVRFKTSTSSNVRVHVVTAPDSTVAGVSFCSNSP